MTKTNEKTSANGLPEGFKSLTRSLPPFLNLGVGDRMEAILENVRVITKTQKNRKGKIETKEQYYYDLRLTGPAKGDDGTKFHKPVSFEGGTVVTLSGSGAIDLAFHKAALAAAGINADTLPKDKEWPIAEWTKLYGHIFFLLRNEDGKMKGGQFMGNKVKQYTIGSKAPAAVPA
jgi:hypothetical protein